MPASVTGHSAWLWRVRECQEYCAQGHSDHKERITWLSKKNYWTWAGRDSKEQFAKNGLLDHLKKALSERILNAELDDHMDGERIKGSVNRRNGTSKKTVLTGTSKIELSVPRDREGRFDPQQIAKYQRRFPDFDAKIISMHARGLSVREVRGHLEEFYGIDVSPDLIPAITDAVLDEVAEWQNRLLDPMFLIVFFNCIRVEIRDVALSATRPSISLLAFCLMEQRRFWAFGLNKRKVRSSGSRS